MAQPRILFITRKWAPAIGGMETYSMRLVEALGESTDLRVLSLPGRADGRPPGSTALLGFALRICRERLFTSRDNDVVHIGDMASWPLALPFLVAKHRPQIVLSAHGTDVSYAGRKSWRGRCYRLYQRIGAYLLSGAKVIANSKATAQAARESGWADLRVVPLATDIAADSPLQEIDGRTLLFAGRLIPLKGCGWFVDQVLPLLPDTMRLHVAGPPWDETERRRMNHPRVDYLGTLDREALAGEYRNAICIVVPNVAMGNGQFEGFGLVAPEAAGAGGVVLASRTGGLIDAVLDGETGFLVTAGDAEAWAEKIMAVATWTREERVRFTDGARLRVQEHFNWDRVARETLTTYLGGELLPIQLSSRN
ncbi:glycosyltransferase family 4 protein [Croceicoccus ponticola]|nr:glycosyltransferase family 4 protein [Croceicoccus ponticola]